jgi:hypothetical protein
VLVAGTAVTVVKLPPFGFPSPVATKFIGASTPLVVTMQRKCVVLKNKNGTGYACVVLALPAYCTRDVSA